MEKRYDNESMLERAARKLDLPGEALAGMPKIEIVGNRRLAVENHRGILEYSDENIEINTQRAVIKVRGTELGIRSMNSETLLIEGFILSVEFEV